MFAFFWVWGGINGDSFPHYPQKNLSKGTKRGRRGRGVRGRGSQEKRQKIGLRGLDLHPHPKN